MKLWKYILRRILTLIPQLFGISVVTFVLIRLLPGDPAYLIAGALASQETIERIRQRMALDKPLYVQYYIYLRNLFQGDMGTSWFTSHPVTEDLVQRFPATIELISLSLALALLIAVPLGVHSASRGRGRLAKRATTVYGLLAGAVPEFWLGLILIFFLYYKVRIAPHPIGRIAIEVSAPSSISGFYLLDSLLTRDWPALRSSLSHLVLPVATLTFVIGAPILKMTYGTMSRILSAEYIHNAEIYGLPHRLVMRYALKNSLPPVVTLVGILYGYLLGGAVLVETIFSWGGMGQYAVQSIINSDYTAVQGFVLVAAVFSLIVYLAVDVIYAAIDPRIKY